MNKVRACLTLRLVTGAALLALSPYAFGQACGVPDSGQLLIPPNYETLQFPPMKGASIIDPTTGCLIRRMTYGAGTSEPPGDPVGRVNHMHSVMPAVNSDGTRLMVHKGSPTGVFVLDIASASVVRQNFNVYEFLEPRWSRTDPSVIYYHRYPSGNPAPLSCWDYTVSPTNPNAECKVMSYNIVTGQHLPVTGSLGAPVGFMGEQDISWDGNHLAIHVGSGASSATNVHVLTLSTGAVSAFTLSGGLAGIQNIDNCIITPSNQVLCKFSRPAGGTSAPFQIFSGTTGAFVNEFLPWSGKNDVTRDPTDLDNNGLLDDDVMILDNSGCNINGGNATKKCNPAGLNCFPGVERIALSNNARTCVLSFAHASPSGGPWFGKTTYISANSAGNNPWVVISTHDAASSNGQPVPNTFDPKPGYIGGNELPLNWQSLWGKYFNEIILAKIDGTQRFRLAHHRSRQGRYCVPDPANPGQCLEGDDGFWSYSHASISNGGRWVVFDSNFNEQPFSRPNYADVFMIDLAGPGGGGSGGGDRRPLQYVTCSSGSDCATLDACCGSGCVPQGSPACQ
jgi:hypothetical protein